MTINHAWAAVTGTWSDLGPVMTHIQSSTTGGNPPIVVNGGYLYVSDRTGVSRISLAQPSSWTYLVNPGSTLRIVKLGINAAGNPIISQSGKNIGVWNGSEFATSVLNPPAGSWSSVGGIATDRGTGFIYTAGNFTIYRSTDNGRSFSQVFDLGTVFSGSNGDGFGWIYTVAISPWRELFVGGETDTIYSSLNGGSTWSPLPKFRKGGNRYGVSPTKDGELLISTAFSDSGDDYFMKYTSTGTLVPATSGLPTYLLNDQSTAVLHMAYLDSGENFVVGKYRSDQSVHCLGWDGETWTSIGSLPNGPGAALLWNSVGTDGSNLYVNTSSGQLKKWTPTAKLPFTVSAGENQSVSLASGASLRATISPAGDYNYSWTARGSKDVSFADASALATTAAFSRMGDYALNIKATNDAGLTVGSTMLIHVGAGVAPKITSNTPTATGTVEAAYSFQVMATGSPAPTFEATALPALGLTISSSGLISGTPSAPGAISGRITASNGTPPNSTQAYSIAIRAVPSGSGGAAGGGADSASGMMAGTAGASGRTAKGVGGPRVMPADGCACRRDGAQGSGSSRKMVATVSSLVIVTLMRSRRHRRKSKTAAGARTD